MMDDFRPGQNGQTDQPSNETNPEPVRSYEQPTEPTAPTEAPTDSTETPVEPSETTVAAPVVVQKKKGRVGKWLLGSLVVLLLVGVAAFAYWQWQEAENARNEVSSLRTSLEASKAQNDKDETKPATQERAVTTMELAERYAEAYKTAGKEITFFTRVEKTDGDAGLIYTKAELPNAEPTYFIVKRIDDSVVVVDSFSPSLSQLQATFLKEVYGIDAARLGVKIEAQ